jgi:hypothetical protein
MFFKGVFAWEFGGSALGWAIQVVRDTLVGMLEDIHMLENVLALEAREDQLVDDLCLETAQFAFSEGLLLAVRTDLLFTLFEPCVNTALTE